MPKSSLEELRGQISAGEYAIDSGALAGDILSKFALIRRVGRLLMSEEAAGDAETGADRQAPDRRQGRSASPSPLQPRERLS
jgi:hypothetical protein